MLFGRMSVLLKPCYPIPDLLVTFQIQSNTLCYEEQKLAVPYSRQLSNQTARSATNVADRCQTAYSRCSMDLTIAHLL